MATDNRLKKLGELGQSVWLDNLSRELLDSGKLKSLIEDDGIKGVTSNPTIFQKAITGSKDYDEAINRHLSEGITDPKELFLALAKRDITDAADLLRPLYDELNGQDGLVSIEVSPDLAYDTEATIKEARELFSSIDRPNVMVKVPATKEGLPAITELISQGVNVNVTLLFSTKRYQEVAEAYIEGLIRRAQMGGPVDHINSVASFFVSRVDNLIDDLLDKKIEAASDASEKEKLKELKGWAAIMNAKEAYRLSKDIYQKDKYLDVKELGARQQRLLWASTSTKNPDYNDVMYIDHLVAPNTVNTMPDKTIDAFRDHGTPALTIEQDIDRIGPYFEKLSQAGIDIEEVAGELEKDGVKKFSDSFFALLDALKEKKEELAAKK